MKTLTANHCFDGAGITQETYQTLLCRAIPEVGTRVEAGNAGKSLRQTGYVLDTLQAALALNSGATCWLAVAEGAALAGDDSDTVACIAGAIAGARGFEVPPALLIGLRVGASWGDWQRDWPAERLAELL